MTTRSQTTHRTGVIAALHLSPKRGEAMRPVAAVTAIPGVGLEGCAHARSGTDRQVLLIEAETLDAFQLPPGLIKENITTHGISLDQLSPGTHLRIGRDTVLELTKPCTPCAMLEKIRPGLEKAMRGKRGTLARVVVGGTFAVDDSIQVVNGKS